MSGYVARWALVITLVFAVLFAVKYASAFVTPCQTEDSTFCYWDASAWGNGVGQSFVTFHDGFTLSR